MYVLCIDRHLDFFFFSFPMTPSRPEHPRLCSSLFSGRANRGRSVNLYLCVARRMRRRSTTGKAYL